MRAARKTGEGMKKRRAKSRSLAPASYDILVDGTHVLVVPVFTENFSNGALGNSKGFAWRRANDKKTQRAMVGLHLTFNDVPRYFRGVKLVRLAPSPIGLDTGGLWSALKAPQDEVAKHLGIDDGPRSPASWELAQEFSPTYGVRIELQAERAPDYRAEVERLKVEVERLRALLATVGVPAND